MGLGNSLPKEINMKAHIEIYTLQAVKMEHRLFGKS